MHPSEEGNEPPKTNTHVQWDIANKVEPLWPLLWHADVIVGLTTKALLEAAFLGRHPLSYQPNSTMPEICTAVRLGLAEYCRNKDELSTQLQERLRTKDDLRTLPPYPNSHAAQNVLTIAVNQEIRHP